MIISGFSSEQASLNTAFKRQELNKDQQESMTISIVEYYLFDLRDMKAESIKSSQTVHEEPSARTGHPGETQLPSVGFFRIRGVYVINPQDVVRFPVRNLFSVLGPLFMKHMGQLQVTSEPDGARIVIDGQKEGFTCKKFVASLGEHDIEVFSDPDHLECRARINVKAGDEERFCCPRDSSCSSFLDGRRCTAP